jgi:hypothetical protein
MFRNPRKLFTAATILAFLLLSALPAAAAGPSRPRELEGAWESLVSRVLSWLGGSESGFSVLWGEYSSMIDPNGQPEGNSEQHSMGAVWDETSSYIDPNGQAVTNSDDSSQIDPNGRR